MIKTNEITQLDIIEVKTQLLLSTIISILVKNNEDAIKQINIYQKMFSERNNELEKKVFEYLYDKMQTDE